MKTGIELINQEYNEMRSKHGYTSESDKQHTAGELLSAANYCITLQKDFWPAHWKIQPRYKIEEKTHAEQLVIAGAFYLAENCRIGSDKYDYAVEQLAKEIDVLLLLEPLEDNNYYPEFSTRTYTGKVFDWTVMDPNSICIEDIMHGMGNTCRWGAQTPHFYSVLQHSIRCCDLAPEEYKLAALLHDGSEGLGLGDMPSPVKKLLPDYKALEHKLMMAIATKFGFQYPLHPIVKDIDCEVLEEEWQQVILRRKNNAHPKIWLEIMFMERFNREMKKRAAK